jgi:biopolymer transport protein ExbD
VPRGQVAEALRRAAGGREAARVEVRVDSDTPYAEAFNLVRTVEDAGLRPRLVLESGRP